MKRHLQSKKHQTYEKANVFSFDASLFPKPKKARPIQIKCDECGKYYKPAYEGHHLRSIIHRRAVDKVPTHNEVVPEVKDNEPKVSRFQTWKNWLAEKVSIYKEAFTEKVTNWIFPKKQKPSEPTSEKPEQKKAESHTIDETFDFDEVAEIVLVETAFLNRLETWVINNVNNFKNPIAFLEYCRTIVIAKLSQWAGIKTNLQLYCDFQREEEIKEFSFKTQNQIILESTYLNTFYVHVVDKLKREMKEFEAKGSGWRRIRVKGLELRINKYNSLRGSSYIDLPKEMKDKKTGINVKNENDNKCFMWSVLSALHPVEQDAQRVSKYKAYENELNFKDIEFPVKMEDRVFKRFEKLNNVSVNIYSYEKQTKTKDKQTENGDIYIYPLRIAENKVDKHVNLLYIKSKDGNIHYCWIKDISKLISS
ncbi:hypothetical protein AVEN_174586-1 [Araneus ventricosus]|uniref:C2H2-type domain-containing protein n=1 Tax=Araneus ventricosus TaxID=182803 RepID=A0A4Y2MQF8_ARAVE|nr:hypothetical protein AVEN_174586-1 [Araneus ventricosus]